MTRRLLALRWFWRWAVILLLWAAVGVAAGLAIRFGLWPHVTVAGDRLSWFDWTVLAGVALAVVGLAVTFVQVLQTRTAAQAASAAVDHALSALAKSELLVDFQTMRQLEYELERAVEKDKDRDTVQSHIREVREVGARVSASLKKKDATDPLVEDIEALRTTASEARVVIMGARKNVNLGSVTRKLREELVPLADKISTRMNELRLDVGSEGDDGG